MRLIDFGEDGTLDLEAIACDPWMNPAVTALADSLVTELGRLREAHAVAVRLTELQRERGELEQQLEELAKAPAEPEYFPPPTPDPAPGLDKPYPCPDCDKWFTTRSGVGGHRGKVHPGSAKRAAAAAEIDVPTPPSADPLVRCTWCDRRVPAEHLVQHRETCAGRPTEPALMPPPPAMHPMVAMCACGHTQRRHEDHSDMCQVCDDCSSYRAAAT